MLAIKVIATICFAVAAALLVIGGFQLEDDDDAARGIMIYLLFTEIIAVILIWKCI